MLTRILASSVRIIPWTLGSPFLSFFYNGGGGGGFCALAMGLQTYIKSMGGGGGGSIYIYVGPYEIRLNLIKVPNSILFFSKFIFFRFNFSKFRFFPFSFYGLLFNDQIKLYLSKSMSN